MNVLLNPLISDPKTTEKNVIENIRENKSENEIQNQKFLKTGVQDNLLIGENNDRNVLNDSEFLVQKKRSKKHSRAHIDVNKNKSKNESDIGVINVEAIQYEKKEYKNLSSNSNNNFNLLNYRNMVEHLPTVNNYLPSLPFYGKVQSPARSGRGSVSFNFDNHESLNFSERKEEINSDLGIRKNKRNSKIE